MLVNNRNSDTDSGFTIVELTVIISLTALLVLTFIGITTNYLVLITKNNNAADMTVNAQNLLRTTVEALRYGDGVRQTNTISDPNAPPGGWNTSNVNFVIVIATPAVDLSHNYIIDPDTGGPYMNELVYYKNGSSLMRRQLANPSAIGNALITSCPTNLANSSCPADKDLADYVNSMTFTLYDQNAVLTTNPAQARSIKIDLSMSHSTFGSSLNLNNSIRVTLRNRF